MGLHVITGHVKVENMHLKQHMNEYNYFINFWCNLRLNPLQKKVKAASMSCVHCKRDKIINSRKIVHSLFLTNSRPIYTIIQKVVKTQYETRLYLHGTTSKCPFTKFTSHLQAIDFIFSRLITMGLCLFELSSAWGYSTIIISRKG